MTEPPSMVPYEQYKRALKKEKRIVLSWQIIIFIGFFACWEIRGVIVGGTNDISFWP